MSAVRPVLDDPDLLGGGLVWFSLSSSKKQTNTAIIQNYFLLIIHKFQLLACDI